MCTADYPELTRLLGRLKTLLGEHKTGTPKLHSMMSAEGEYGLGLTCPVKGMPESARAELLAVGGALATGLAPLFADFEATEDP